MELFRKVIKSYLDEKAAGEPGKYGIERRDGGFFVTDCRWKEEAR